MDTRPWYATFSMAGWKQRRYLFDVCSPSCKLVKWNSILASIILARDTFAKRTREPSLRGHGKRYPFPLSFREKFVRPLRKARSYLKSCQTLFTFCYCQPFLSFPSSESFSQISSWSLRRGQAFLESLSRFISMDTRFKGCSMARTAPYVCYSSITFVWKRVAVRGSTLNFSIKSH